MHELLAEAYDAITDTVTGLGDDAFERPTRTAAWTVRELLLHQLLDAQRALMALACTTDARPDVDELSYWAPFRPGEGDGGAAHARFVRAAAAAYASPRGLVAHWRDTAQAAVRAARAADLESRFETQGHVIALPDLLSTLVLEASVHHLDLIHELPAAPPTPARGLALTRRVLEGLLAAPLPPSWSDADAALRGTGREPLTAGDRAALGDSAARFPLLG